MTVALILLIAGVALFVRTYFPAGYVLTDYVNFQTPDSWYHMRLVDSTIRNFPHHIGVDPYLGPQPAAVGVAPLLDVLTAGAALVVGRGAPSARQLDVVAAFVPPLLGALCVVPAYAVGGRLFGRAAGLFGAAMLAVMPGSFLDRSVLGYTDHHVLEVLLSATTLALLLGAIDAQERQPTGRPVIAWAALAGLALGAYLLAWGGGALVVFALWVWLVVQSTLDALRGRSCAPVLRIAAIAFGIALALVLLGRDPRGQWVSLQIATLGFSLATVALIATLERVATWRPAHRLLRPVVLGVILLGTAMLVMRLAPALVKAAGDALIRLQPGRTAGTVAEAIPLLRLFGMLTPGMLWSLFGTSIVLGLAVLPVLGYLVLRHHAPGRSLMVVWTFVMLAVTLGQNRFAYYLAFAFAVLSGAACAAAFDWSLRGAAQLAVARAVMAVLLAAVAIAPNLKLTVAAASFDDGVPAPRHAALEWLRRESPEPFTAADYYYARYASPGRGGAPLQRAAYTVMTWWDHGYEVIRIAHRVPAANPTQAGARLAARFYLATDEQAATRALARARSRYVIVTDEQVYVPRASGAFVTTFDPMAVWAGRRGSEFVEQVLERQGDGRLSWATIFHPSYYRTMVSRLYLFGGREATPENSTWVITSAPAGPAAHIVASRRFATHEEARRYLDGLGPGPHALVGRDPLRAPVPIPALRDFALVHESSDAARRGSGLPSVRIFELTPAE